MAKLIELIYTEELRGGGTANIFRRVQQLWTKDGHLIAEHNPCGRPLPAMGEYRESSFMRSLLDAPP